VLVTPGAKNALFVAAAALLEPGDEAVNLSPCYVSNVPILKLAEPSCKVVDVPLAGPDFALDRERLSAAVGPRTKLLLANYPNNPTGRMLDAGEAGFLLGLLRANPGLRLVSDEIYERIVLGDRPMSSPAAAADVRSRVVTVNGLSKAYAMTGWRVGYAHAAPELIKRMTRIHSQLNTHTATFTQKAAAAALTGPQDHLAAFVKRLKACKALYERFLAARPRFPGSKPEGGFFSFLDIRAAGLGSDAFCTALLEETGVALLPGLSFGPAYDGYCRVSLAVPEADFAKALDLLGRFLDGRKA
jgi:aspartate aminotransferase